MIVEVVINGLTFHMEKGPIKASDLKAYAKIPQADELHKVVKVLDHIQDEVIEIKGGEEFVTCPRAGVGG